MTDDDNAIDKTTGEILHREADRYADLTAPVTPPPDLIKFSEWLASFNGGALDDDMSIEIDKLVQDVLLQGKTGTLTLKLSVKDEGGGVIVEADVTAKPPKTPRAAFFFRDENRKGLSRHDPQQPKMPGFGD
jgi:hypothetical protein